jgi:predicted TIM-barrel fold metal-dependent hydrolase
MSRLDIHSHIICPDFVDRLAENNAYPLVEHRDGKRFVRSAPGLVVPEIDKLIDIDVKLSDMDELEVDFAVLSHAIPGPEVLGGTEADAWAARINDYLAGLVARGPDRLAAWGLIGFGDADRSRAEIDRCLDELGFRGFQLYANIGGRMLDAADVLEVLEYAAERGAPLNLHPTIPVNTAGMEDLAVLTGLGFVTDTSLATLRLILSGIFDRFPSMRLIVPHVGGVLPYIRGRISAHSGRGHIQARNEEGLEHPIGHYLEKLHLDTVTGDVTALRCAYELVGEHQLLYGTDHPFANYRQAAAIVEQFDLDDDERSLVYEGNARIMLGLG